MEYAMETSCTIKSIVCHHFEHPRDVMMTFVFGWGKTNIQQVFRKEEMNAKSDEQLEAMRNDPTSAIFDYQVSSAERFKHVNNDMFMNGSQDSDSHSPLMVYIRSRSAARQRNFERSKEHQKKKQSWTQQEYKDYNKQCWGNPKQCGMIEETEEPVQIHVGRTFQKVLLQRVLEVVDSFIRILQKVILEDCLVHIGISCESALEQRSCLGCLHRTDCHPVVHEFFIPKPADFSVVRRH